MTEGKVNVFSKIGRLIIKRKYTLIALWVILLALVLPVAITASGVNSLQMGASTDKSLESVKADNIISSQFSRIVANNSLIIVISADNVSSVGVQQFINQLTEDLHNNKTISGIENITSIYSILVPALNGTNQGVYFAYKNANLTYTMLYSVPYIYSQVWSTAFNTTVNNLNSGLTETNQGVYQVLDNSNQTYSLLFSVPLMYLNIWSAAYNQTHDNLVLGLNQTNQGVYSALANANLTYNMLYGTPAIYLNAWSAAYNQTSNVDQSNYIANQTTANSLYAVDPLAYKEYTSQLLSVFNTIWSQSFSNATMVSYTPLERASYASNLTNQQYIANFLTGNATNQAFTTALTNTLSFTDFLTNSQDQNNAKLTAFAIQTVTAASNGTSSSKFVTAAYNLGLQPSVSAISTLTDTIIVNPDNYQMGTNFISIFNQVAFNQSSSLLQQADAASYIQYTRPLLIAFNATWSTSFLDPATQYVTPLQRAIVASQQTNQLYINNILTDNNSKTFVNALTNTFTLQDFLSNTQNTNNAKLQNFALNYLTNQSGASYEFVKASYDLGRTPQSDKITELTSDIIWNSQSYKMGQNFIDSFNDVAKNQTADILRRADASSYENYTSHLLTFFDSAWRQSFVDSSRNLSVNARASAAASIAISQFIDNYLNDNRDFVEKVAAAFDFQDFSNANTTDTNLIAKMVAANYVSNQSGLSPQLVNAIYNLGENASIIEVRNLASNIVNSPELYKLSQQFNELLDSFVSPDKEVTLISLNLNQSSEQNLLNIRSLVKQDLLQSPDGIKKIQVTGKDALNYDFSQSTQSDLEIILPITIILLIVATALFFRSIVTPIITLGTIGVGLGVSQIFPYLVGTYINQVDYTVTTVLLTVLIGVGTDYSIFILARHREERVNGLSLNEAIKKSITWAGESIATSGATVIISFLALASTTMVLLQTMGLIVGLGVVVTLLVSLTFAPALVAILGDKVFWPNTGERFQRYSEEIIEKNRHRVGYFARSGAFSVKHGKVLIIIAVLVTVPAFYVYATTVPTYDLMGSASNSLESIAASNILTSSFGGSRLMPTYVVVTFSKPLLENGSFNMGEMSTIQNISSTLASHPGVQEADSPTMPYGEAVDYRTITNSSDFPTYSGILSAIGSDNKSTLITVKFHDDPYSTQAMSFAKDLRSSLHQEYDGFSKVTGIYVGGTTGEILDTRNQFQNQFNTILPIVALGVGVVLFFVLGSLILPVFAIASVLMSIVWTVALTMVVFQTAFNFGLLFITPLILFVLLLGLGMDYNIFILTRIREEATKGQHLNDAIIHAIQQTGGIITAAAVILAGSLGTLLLSSNMLLREMGFAFCFSILIDALVVRTYVVPAVMSTFGKWNWYNPIKRLRRLKDIDK